MKNYPLQPCRRHRVLPNLLRTLSLPFVAFSLSLKGCRGFLIVHEQLQKQQLKHHHLHHHHGLRKASYRSLVPSFRSGRTTSTDAFTKLHAKRKPKHIDENDIFDEYFSENIAKDVSKNLNVPFYIPEPIVTFLVEEAVQKLSTDLSNDTKTKLQEFMQAQATPTSNDNFVEQEINDLSNRIAKEINPKIDVPVLDEDQELILLQQILTVMLQSMAKDPDKNLVEWTNTNLQMSRDLLGGPASRLQLARSIDTKMEMFKIPLPEAQRLALIQKAVDSSADLLTRLLPPGLLETLKGESPEGLLKMKEYLINNVNAKLTLWALTKHKRDN